MRIFVFLFFFTIYLTSSLIAQNFEACIKSIQQNHNLMGGVVLVLSGNEVKKQVPFGLADHQRNL
ncbi:MAG: hypothetical protein K9H65_05855, partial [Bacteroidales bacterium]|nr:hypothetical protein [Bacteroidales bacterium]